METASAFPKPKQWFNVERTGNRVKISIRKQSGKTQMELSCKQAKALADALIAKLHNKVVAETQPEDMCWRDPEIM